MRLSVLALPIVALTACGDDDNPVASSDVRLPDRLDISRSAWTPATSPTDGLTAPSSRGRLVWYNPFDRVRITDIWPDSAADGRSDEVDVLVLELWPPADVFPSWGGVMSAFPDSARDISTATHLEIWIRGEQGEVQIDLGSMSEDWNADGLLNTEDAPLPGRSTGDGLLHASEDIGLDGRDDAAELVHYLESAGADTSGLSPHDLAELFAKLNPDRDPQDPEGDNWSYDPTRDRNDYSRINGTQGNRRSTNGQLPDTEDIDGDGILDTTNDYFHFKVDLGSAAHVPGSQFNGWRLLRLPLFSPDVSRVGSPDSSAVNNVRVIVVSDGSTPPTLVEIAAISIPGANLR